MRRRLHGSRDELSVGFFGILGSGNLGNDASLDAVVSYLRERHPDAQLSFFCMGPEQMAAIYGGPATALQWYEPHAGNAEGWRAGALKIVGKLLDPFRTVAWVRHRDVVIVPGMGVLEATLPLRPWAFPYSLFWLGVAARISGTKVALVSVGANVVSKRATRWFIVRAARLAHYRSYRDEQSRAAMQAMGVDVHADQVFPDLAFALPVPPSPVAASNAAVGIGLMAYYGGNDDRARAEQLHRAYVDTMRQFVRWLLDSGRQVRLFAGDRADEPVIAAILSDAQTYRARAGQVSAEPFRSMQEVLQQVASVDTVIASRYHNVLGALKLGKLTLSLGYAAKHDALMATMGLGAFSMSAAAIDLDELIGRFTALEAERDALEAILVERNRRQRQLVDRQFDALSTTLFPVAMGAAVTEATG